MSMFHMMSDDTMSLLSNRSTIKNYNINVVNSTTEDDDGFHGKVCAFRETRSEPILYSSRRMQIALQRATLQTESLPVFTPQIQLGQSDPNLMQAYVGIGGTITYTSTCVTATGTLPSAIFTVGVKPNTTFIDNMLLCVPDVLLFYSNSNNTLYPIVLRDRSAFPVNITGFVTPPLISSLYQVASAITTGTSNAITATVDYTTNSQWMMLLSGSVAASTQLLNFDDSVAVRALIAAYNSSHTLQLTVNDLAITRKFLNITDGNGPVASNHTAVVTATYPVRRTWVNFADTVSDAVTTTKCFPTMGITHSIDVYNYRSLQWVPEDTSAPIPNAPYAQQDYGISAIGSSTYYFAYSYDHVLTNVVNAGFASVMRGATAASGDFQEQSIATQLSSAVAAVQNTTATFDINTSYAVNACVIYNGSVYLANFATKGVYPTLENGPWFYCGTSIYNSYDPRVLHPLGSFIFYNGTLYCYTTAQGVGAFNAGNVTAVTTPSYKSTSVILASQPPRFEYHNGAVANINLFLDQWGFGGDNRDSYGKAAFYARNPQVVNTTSYPLVTPVVFSDENFHIESSTSFATLIPGFNSKFIPYNDPFTNVRSVYCSWDIPQTSGCPTVAPLALSPSAEYPFYDYSARQLARWTANNCFSSELQTFNGGTIPLFEYTETANFQGALWSPIESYMLITQNLPIEPTLYAPRTEGVGFTSSVPVATSGDTLKILTDFSPEAGSNVYNVSKGVVYFKPDAQWRLVDMGAGQVVRDFDCKLVWVHRTTRDIFPVMLSPTGSFSAKFIIKQAD